MGASAQRSYGGGYDREYTTPVPILKQIDRHNDDGSYSYGWVSKFCEIDFLSNEDCD